MRRLFVVYFAALTGVFALFAATSLGFAAGMTVNRGYFVLFVLTTVWTMWRTGGKDVRGTVVSAAVLWGVLVCAGVLSHNFYDFSYDGAGYHRMSAYFLEKGWNPVYEQARDFALRLWPAGTFDTIWTQHYVKFGEIVAANVNLVSGSAEAGKAVNETFALMVFCFAAFVFSGRLPKKKAFALAFLLAFAPVVAVQSLSYYVDALFYCAFMLCALAFVHLNTESLPFQKQAFAGFVFAGTILANVKLSGLPAVFLFIAGGAAYLRFFTDGRKTRPFVKASAAVCLLIALTGINPYLTNLIQEKSLFYPVTGDNAGMVLYGQTPVALKGKGFFGRFAASLFAEPAAPETDASAGTPDADGFMFYPPFNRPFALPDARVGGFGGVFGGVLTLCLLFALTARFEDRRDRNLFLFLLSLIGSTTLANPSNWWARFVPQLWGGCILTLYFASCARKGILRKSGVFWTFCVALLLNNAAMPVQSVAAARLYSADMKRFYTALAVKPDVPVYFDGAQTLPFPHFDGYGIKARPVLRREYETFSDRFVRFPYSYDGKVMIGRD